MDSTKLACARMLESSIQRRAVLKAVAGAVGLASALEIAPASAAAKPSGGVVLEQAIQLAGLSMGVTDNRFAATSSFGLTLQRAGLVLHRMDGDITSLWFDHLEPRLRGGSREWFAGCSAVDSLLCLEQMAADHRASARVRLVHRQVGDRIEHDISAPQALLRPIGRALERADGWQTNVARVFCDAQPHELATPRAQTSIVSLRHAAPRLQATLVSWLLGPTRI